MRRDLSLTEGTSDKFWSIEVLDNAHTVVYGRRGTKGTSKTKTFASSGEALHDAEKLIAAKLRKGYHNADQADSPTIQHEQASPAQTAPQKAPEHTTPHQVDTEASATPRHSTPPASPPASADDLGLPSSPFTDGYRLELSPRAEYSTIEFDADATRALFVRCVKCIPYAYGKNLLYVTVQSPFTDIPPQGTRDVWLDCIDATVSDPRHWIADSHDPAITAAIQVSGSGTDAAIPPRDWHHHSELRLFPLRAVLHLASDDVRAAAAEAATAPLPDIFGHDHSTATFNSTAAFVWAAILRGGGDDVADAIMGMPISNSSTSREFLPLALLGRTPAERVKFARHLKVNFDGEYQSIVAWLHATGALGFDIILKSLEQSAAPVALVTMQVAALAMNGPGAVPFFVRALLTKGAQSAADWLRAHPEFLLSADLSQTEADLASVIVWELPHDVLAAALPNARGAMAQVIARILELDVLPEFDTNTAWWRDLAPQTIPEWVNLDASGLPPFVIDGRRLDEKALGLVIYALLSPAEQAGFLDAVRAHSDPADLDEFATGATRTWLVAGAPREERWRFTATAPLGGKRYVAQADALATSALAAGQHQRAGDALTAMEEVGSDDALRRLLGHTSGKGFPAFRRKARESMGRAATRRGLTRDELEDRVLPTFGFDARGQRQFSYGTRSFVVSLTSDAKLTVQQLDDAGSPTGKPRASLPPVNKSDDGEMAENARAEFTAMKKDLTKIVKQQRGRFERAMVSRARWNPQDHATYILGSPVLRVLASSLIWGVYDGDELRTSVRFDEDLAAINVDDEVVDLSGATLGVIHPIELSGEDRAAWQAILTDEEVVPAFAQLDRGVYYLPADQGDDLTLHGVPVGGIEPGRFVGAINRFGWQHGVAEDNGLFFAYGLQVPEADLTLALECSGLWSGPVWEQQPVELLSVRAFAGAPDPNRLGSGLERNSRLTPAAWSDVPPELVSEVYTMLAAMEGSA